MSMAEGSWFGQYKMMQKRFLKNPEKLLKPWHMGVHPKVLSESFLMNTNMPGFRCFSKDFAPLCLGQK